VSAFPASRQERRVGLAPVAEHVGLVDDQEGRRQAGELLVACAK
jgi:hypothetical protein